MGLLVAEPSLYICPIFQITTAQLEAPLPILPSLPSPQSHHPGLVAHPRRSIAHVALFMARLNPWCSLSLSLARSLTRSLERIVTTLLASVGAHRRLPQSPIRQVDDNDVVFRRHVPPAEPPQCGREKYHVNSTPTMHEQCSIVLCPTARVEIA